jgi:hypothetical protein
MMHGKIMNNNSKKYTDHINGNGLDNRKENLREGRYINVLNTDKRKKPCPIYKNKLGYWYGQTTIEGKKFYIKQSDDRNEIVKMLSELLIKHNRLHYYKLTF